MSFQVNVPPSVVAKLARTDDVVDEISEKKKKEDWRKIKELEEARKAGTAPAMQDEEGKDINPHIPQYIMQAPWYSGSMQPTLKHQREPDERKKVYTSMDEWYIKGAESGKVASKFRKDACENCGAMGHNKKTCLERPRTRGAKYTGNFAPDDYEQPTLNLSFDGKRDRWNGYDPREYNKVLEDYQKVEEVKRELKAKKLDTSLLGDEGEKVPDEEAPDEDDEDGDEDKYAEDVAMPGQKFETKQRITVRNLRIREDTAKYLYNLDVSSAFYDPKTRAMRANPFDGKGLDPTEVPYAGDNFVRYSGEAHDAIKKQMFAWEAYSKGTDVNVQADPTKLELLHREFTKKKESYKESLKGGILEKYGGQEHLDAPPKEFLLGQNEEYVEYTRHGTLVKGNKKRIIKSRYEEDVLEKNHTSVWGSFWDVGRWGYKCCHSLVRGSYCIGEAGRKNQGNDEEKDLLETSKSLVSKDSESKEVPGEIVPVKSMIDSNSLLHQHLEKMQAEEIKKKKNEKRKKKKKSHKKRDFSDSSSSSGSDDDDSKDDTSSGESKKKRKKKHKKRKKTDDDHDDDCDKKLKRAIAKEKQRQREVEMMLEKGERNLPYNVMYNSKAPTEEDIEAYQKLRMRSDDPMNRYFTEKS